MIALLLASAAAQDPAPVAPAATPPVAVVPGETWATAGAEHEFFAFRDVNGDGFDDVVVMTPDKRLLASESVQGWKASPWKEIAATAWPGGLAAFEEAARAPSSPARVPAPPPYEPELTPVRVLQGDLNGDELLDTLAVFRCTRPSAFLELRAAFALGANVDDLDGDGLPNSQEIAIGSDPEQRDSDGDGLLDGWEVLGLPRAIALGPEIELDPRRQDVLVAISPYAGIDRTALDVELHKCSALYRALPNSNRDGSTGIWVHFRVGEIVPPEKQFGGDWQKCGQALLDKKERGLLHWMQVTSGSGGQSAQTGDMGGSGLNFATIAHELGHQLSLGHEGDSQSAWCPLYPSLMNYAFAFQLGGDASAVRFSSGAFRASVLNEKSLAERLPYPYAALKYLESPPFRFTLKEHGPGETLIDWNQNGRFDEQPVSADVNYGGSTSCGVRQAGELIGAAPALAYVGDTCHLATLDQTQGALTLRTYQGNGQWGPPRVVPNSATEFDPVLVGVGTHGYLFFRRANGWNLARFDAQTIEEPRSMAAWYPNQDLSAGVIGGKAIVVSRADDGTLTAMLMNDEWKAEGNFQGAGVQSSGTGFELRSDVPVAIAQDPTDGRAVIASALRAGKSGPARLRLTWFRTTDKDGRLVQEETRWVRGENSNTECSTRPCIVFDAQGQLNVFHTGGLEADGLMAMWRTRRVGNQALDEGWLTCQLYDIWTRTRRPIAVASGPQGALFGFRWDAGNVWDWRNNMLVTAFNAFGIDPDPMRDFDDAGKLSQHGLVHSILWMQPDPAQAQ